MRGLAVAVVLALAWAAPAAARPLAPACTDTFQVVGPSRDWNTAANWTNGVPTPADDVCILAGIPQLGTATPVIRSLYAPGTPLALTGDFTVTGAVTVQSLAVSAGTVSVGGPLAVAGVLDLSGGTVTSAADGTVGDLVWSGGTLGGTGTTTVTGAATLVGGTLTGRTLRLTGDATVASGTTIAGTGTLVAAAPLTVHAPATIAAPFTAAAPVSVDGGVLTLTRTQLDAPLTVAAGAAVANPGLLDLGDAADVAGAGTLINTGTLRKAAGPGTVAIAPAVTNQGTIDVESGTLKLASLNGGTLGAGTYVLRGTLLVPDLQITDNAGTIRLTDSGTLSDGAHDALAGLARNSGTLDLGGHDLALTGGLANSGTVRLGGGTLSTAGSYVQTAGLTSLDSGTLHAGTPVEIRGGRLEGTGTVVPGLLNAGTVAPGTPLAVTGDYVQTAAGTLAAPPGGLAVTGTATLAGTLAVDPGAVSDGATFPLLTAAAVAGQWAAPPASPDYSFDVGYAATSATLTAHKVRSAIIACDPCTPQPLPIVAPPPGKGAATDAVQGTVLVKQPGTNVFTPVSKGTIVRPGTTVDATKGTISLVAASSKDGKAPPTQISVAAAIFTLQQQTARDKRTEVTDVVIKTPAGLAHACAPRKGLEPSRIATIRRIRVKVAKGVVRTLAAAAVLTTRNASFAMRDRCDGTSTRLRRGKGTVFDRVTGRRVRLSAAARKAYIARTKLFQIRQARLRKIPKP